MDLYDHYTFVNVNISSVGAIKVEISLTDIGKSACVLSSDFTSPKGER